MNHFQKGIIQLINSALTGSAAEIPDGFDWETAYKLGKQHQIIPMLYYGINNSRITPPEKTIERLEHGIYRSVFISQSQLFELSNICSRFDKDGIDYMPLKGALLKFLYPKSEMRPMGDLDILIKTDQYEKIRPIMRDLGFTEICENDHELVWNKNDVLHIELHKRLIPSYNKDYSAYYGDGWRLAKPADKSRFEMSDEDNFIYLFTHYAKHYRGGGIGIRHITDLYVFLSSKPEIDKNYISKELKKLQLFDFYNNTLKTLSVWFDNAEQSKLTDFITDKIFGSGSFGTFNSKVISQAVKDSKSTSTSSRVRYKIIIRSIFKPYGEMAEKYPVLKKYPVLLPVMWVVRWVTVILFKKQNLKQQGKRIKLSSSENISSYQNELDYVGLDFNFKE